MQTPQGSDPWEESKVPAPIINIYHFHGSVDKIIQETRHDSAGHTAQQDRPPLKNKQPLLQYLYWIIGIAGVAVAIYAALFRK